MFCSSSSSASVSSPGSDRISLFDESALSAVFDELNIKPLHLDTFWSFLLKSRKSPLLRPIPLNETAEAKQSRESQYWDEIAAQCSSLPDRLIDRLRSQFTFLRSRVVEDDSSGDGSTTKLLIQLPDGQQIESVVIRHSEKEVAHTEINKESDDADRASQSGDSESEFLHSPSRSQYSRVTLCISSQVGCLKGCKFCATGWLGFLRHLQVWEIVEQLIHGGQRAAIRNIVFMGQGEPLDNYGNVLAALRFMVNQKRLAMNSSRVTVSTVGVIPKIRALARDAPFAQLALSLHAPNQGIRESIVPSAKTFKYDELIDALDEFMRLTKKRVLIEYCVLKGINDSDECAHELGELLRHRNVLMNFIPYNYNPQIPMDYLPPEPERVKAMVKILHGEYGVLTTIRQEMGRDISGACGQLALKRSKEREEKGQCSSGDSAAASNTAALEDLEDIVKSSGNTTGMRRRKEKSLVELEKKKNEEKKENKQAASAVESKTGKEAAIQEFIRASGAEKIERKQEQTKENESTTDKAESEEYAEADTEAESELDGDYDPSSSSSAAWRERAFPSPKYFGLTLVEWIRFVGFFTCLVWLTLLWKRL